jgi:hydrogenase small subunit
VSSTTSRVVGGGIRSLRKISQRDRNRTPLWDKEQAVPSGWARHKGEPTPVDKVAHFFYEKLQFAGSERPGRTAEDEQFHD